MSKLQLCSSCNKLPADLIRIVSDNRQYCYYVCSSCGKRTKEILLESPEAENDTWRTLAEEWNNIN